jgi:hypothetical protein
MPPGRTWALETDLGEEIYHEGVALLHSSSMFTLSLARACVIRFDDWSRSRFFFICFLLVSCVFAASSHRTVSFVFVRSIDGLALIMEWKM